MTNIQGTKFRLVSDEFNNEQHAYLSKHSIEQLGKARVFHLEDGDYVMSRQNALGKGGYGTCYAGVGPRGEPLCIKEVSLREKPGKSKILQELDENNVTEERRAGILARCSAESRRGSAAESVYSSGIQSAFAPRYCLYREHKIYLIMPLGRRDVEAKILARQEISFPTGEEPIKYPTWYPKRLVNHKDFYPTDEFSSQRKSAAMYDLLLPVAEALAALHEHGILHNDVRRENLLISQEGKVCLMDFNAAIDLRKKWPWEIDDFTNDKGAPRHTRAPELAYSEVQDRNSALLKRKSYLKADIYALADTAIKAVIKKGFRMRATMSHDGICPGEYEPNVALLAYIESVLKGHPLREPETQWEKMAIAARAEIEVLQQPLPQLLAAMLSVNPEDRPTAIEVVKILRAKPIVPPNGERSWWSYLEMSSETARALAQAQAQRQHLIQSGQIADKPLVRSQPNSVTETEICMPAPLTRAEKNANRFNTKVKPSVLNAFSARVCGIPGWSMNLFRRSPSISLINTNVLYISASLGSIGLGFWLLFILVL